MSRSQQRKGADGEQELAALLRGHGYEMERGGSLSFGEVPDLVGLPGVHIECKRVERLNVGAAMGQAIQDAERFGDGAPTLFHRRNRSPWLVTMRLEDWLRLYNGQSTMGQVNRVNTRKGLIFTDRKGVDRNDATKGKSPCGLADVLHEGGGGNGGGDQ